MGPRLVPNAAFGALDWLSWPRALFPRHLKTCQEPLIYVKPSWGQSCLAKKGLSELIKE